jgi:rubrerythrin
MGETIKNLCKAFVGESQARNRYTFYAKIAKKEGFVKISKIFEETAEQEKTHAKRLFEHIQELKENENPIQIETDAPTIYGTTIENLKAAIGGEHFEHESMYPEFAEKAEEEGHALIAARLRSIAKAEKHHEERYQKILEQLEKGTFFKKQEETTWVCQECGYEHTGKEPPEKCPSCNHPKDYFEVKCEIY